MNQKDAALSLGRTLVVASHNEGKVREIRELLEPFGIETRSAGELGLEEPEETGLTFAANAELKAVAAAKASGLPALADDSGLAVDALGGDPGIYSARWAGEPRDFGRAMEKVEAALKENGALTPKDRGAQFVCSLSLASPGEPALIFEGTVKGTLIWPPQGTKGFGYDPVFRPVGEDRTFGEMDPSEKHAISHRARAFEKFVAHIKGKT
jgi:XTP/dITP diphosphohydrolase